jgi:hypothetical protein
VGLLGGQLGVEIVFNGGLMGGQGHPTYLPVRDSLIG